MAATTVARLIFNSIVPEKYRSEIPEDHPIGSKEVHDILQRVAEEEPERYKDISFKLLRLGSKGAVETGSSFSMKDLESPIDKKQLLAEVAEQERNIFADKTLDAEKRERELAKLYNKYSRRMPEMVYDASISKGSNLAKMVASGARGNKSQLNSNIGADFLVMDQNNIPVPIGIKHSYAEGMDPAEYFAASYGTRAGLVATKFSTQNSGFLCLSKGCEVRMADFSTKKIEDIQVGDTVLGANKEFQTFPVNVTSKFENGVRECHRFTFATQEGPLEVACTASHKFLHFSGGEYAMAPIGEVDLGTSFPVACPRGKYVAKLDSFIEIGEVETFDIEVDHPDHLFVLGTGLVVSNSKQINASAMDLLVTQDDCQTDTGIPVGVNERDNVGAVLAKGVSGYPAGTLLTPKIIGDIKGRGKEQILVRSAMTCQAPSGVCAKCAGIRERGRFPSLSDSVGLAAASALSEPLSQSLLSTKHSAGVANASKVTGFPAINALFQVPETFPDKASLSEVEGSVDRIEELPQGGFNVVVNEQNHYVSPEHEILVKKGDKVEAGDRISSGTMNPADVVRLKGIGAGRLSLLKQIQDTFHENGINVSRRNAEIVTRAVIDHVKVDDADETSEFLPDEIVEYGAFAKSYVPREDSVKMAPQRAIGKYLEKPVMHYSIGTKVTPSVAKSLGDMEEKEVLVSDKQPNFSPRMVRLMENPSYDRDWMSQLGTSYVQKNLKKNVVSGDVFSDIHGVNPLPALAYGKEFGKPPKGIVGY